MQNKVTYICFFPSDWLSDISLHQCSVEARGVWIDMLCVMAKSPKYGYLVNPNGSPISLERLASLIRVRPQKLEICLSELEAEGVFKRDKDGIIYSSRLIKDLNKILKNRESSRERMQRFREAHSSPKHSCQSPSLKNNPWDYFISKGYGKDVGDWEKAGKPLSGEIKRCEEGLDPWPDNWKVRAE